MRAQARGERGHDHVMNYRAYGVSLALQSSADRTRLSRQMKGCEPGPHRSGVDALCGHAGETGEGGNRRFGAQPSLAAARHGASARV